MSGTWSEIDNPWYESRIVNCSFCGQMIARRIYAVGVGDDARTYCSESCADRAHDAGGGDGGDAD